MITLSDPTHNEQLQSIFKNNYSIKSEVGCTIEYNMNSLIDDISVTYASSLESMYMTSPDGKFNVFKKLFPVDSIIKPFRPVDSGIKYYVLLPNDTTSQSFSAYRTVQYPSSQPRIYYPGITTAYKYWVTPKDADADLTVTYASGVGNSKNALANKIVIQFEKHHALPTNYTVTITKSDNTTTVIGPLEPNLDGSATIYYNGTSWTKNNFSEPTIYPEPISIKSIRLQATNPDGGKIIGVIEVSARWIKDLSKDIAGFDLNKESSASSEDLLPVGVVTANSLSLELAKYGENSINIVSYNRGSAAFDPSLIYMAKNAELNTHIKIYHSNGSITSGSDKYDKVSQGVFYINDWSIAEYGDTAITALDGTKYLMETICSPILCESYPVTAIIRRLLDSIGFTNYNFNLASSETSVPMLNYWWTEQNKTVWESIQELCRDIQMNAFFDENNVLQFYSRDYLYSKTQSNWDLFYETSEVGLANIINFNQKEIASANSVIIRWQTPMTSNYLGNSKPLWKSPTKFLAAGALDTPIDANTSAENTILKITVNSAFDYIKQQALNNFQGYVLIDSEIIEFDAIRYQYTDKLTGGSPTLVWIESDSDYNKYMNLSKPGYLDSNKTETAYFRPTGEYRVKTRGALGTTPAKHTATSLDTLVEWTGRTVTWS